MSKSLVTGGSGFIGSHLVEKLLAEGHDVRVLDDLSTGKEENLQAVSDQIEIVHGDVYDLKTVENAVKDCEFVYHLAALPSVTLSVEDPIRSHAVTATGTLHVLDASRRTGVKRVVYAASSSCYGNIPGDAKSEGDLLSPMSPYAAAKLCGEHYCQCFHEVYGLETVRLRFFNVYGPRQDPKSPYSGVIAIFTSLMLADKQPRIDGDGLQTRDFVYVANVVQAILKAATASDAPGNVYNVGNGGSITIVQLVQHLNDLLGTKLDPVHGPPRPGDVRRSQADISRARKDLGYEPTVDFVEGLKHTLEHHRSTT